LASRGTDSLRCLDGMGDKDATSPFLMLKTSTALSSGRRRRRPAIRPTPSWPTDANDMLYAFDASRDYDPSPGLEKIAAPVLALNSADDEVNPPELGLMEQLMPRVRNGCYVLIPTSEETRGHGTHSLPAVWGSHLKAFLKALAR
jgi:pimeloyl-ACP methyl ester carboxylesterase